MKLLKKILFIFVFPILILSPVNVSASQRQVNVYMFYGKTCPHCEEATEYLNSIKDKYNLKLYRYEVWYNDNNQKLMRNVAEFMDINVTGVPFTIINNKAIFGYSKGMTDETYRYNIKEAAKESFVDKVGVEIGVVDKSELEKQNNDTSKDNNSYKINLPIIGNVDLKNLSLPVLSILIGVIDGFNPCAMWVLLFLISTLIGMKDKKRLWILGVAFLVTSSLIYLAFMVSWLQFAKMISAVAVVRMLIALVAVIGGALNLKSYADSLVKGDGCDVVNAKKRKKIFSKIRNFTHEKKFIFAILGVMLLAVSVNLIELACSAGLPVIYTQILAMNDLSTTQYWIYIIMYIFFFMLDDLIIFAVAIKTFEVTGISTKYSKYSHLVGGIIMIIIGILLVVKPEWLMFNF